MAVQACIRLMTYNIGGGRKDFGSNLESILKVVKTVAPDFLVVQEAVKHIDAEGICHSDIEQIAKAGQFGNNYHFGVTLALRDHMHAKKTPMVYGVFQDWQDWRYGNAVFYKKGFVRLSDSSKPGFPRDVPIYSPPTYEGNRDTESRTAILSRINEPPLFPFVVGLHLTALVGERGQGELPGKAQEARALRMEQSQRLLDLTREHLLKRGQVVFLLGDFNAMADEACIQVLEKEGGFVRLTPENSPHPTHPKAPEAIDHIFVYPGNKKLVEYRCWIVDDEIARQASDHLPVVADIAIE